MSRLKLKTRKASKKRYKITKNNKILSYHAFKGHLLNKKRKNKKRKLSQQFCISAADKHSIKLMLPYF